MKFWFHGQKRRRLKTSQDILSPRWSPARHRHPPHSGALCRLARCGSTTGTVILVEGDSNGAQSLVGYHHWPVLCPPLVATGSRLSKIRVVPSFEIPGASPDTSSKYSRVCAGNDFQLCCLVLLEAVPNFNTLIRQKWPVERDLFFVSLSFFFFFEEMFRWQCDRCFVC